MSRSDMGGAMDYRYRTLRAPFFSEMETPVFELKLPHQSKSPNTYNVKVPLPTLKGQVARARKQAFWCKTSGI